MYEWQLDLIRALQKISNGFTDFIFLNVTQLGEELVFIAVAVILFICFDKKFGFKLIMTYMLGSFIIDIMKEGFMVDRPYVLDPALGIGAPTEGFSFPSGHTMTATVIYLMLAVWLVRTYKLSGKKKIWTYAAAGILIFLVAFSRIYLGQHYLTDVLGGFAIGAVTVLIYLVLDKLLKGREIFWTALLIPALVLAIVRPDYKNYYMALGVIASISLGYFLEKRFVGYGVREKWWIQLIKIAVCLGVAIGLKEGLKPLLDVIGLPKDGGPSALIRYFLVGLWASLAFPAICKRLILKIFKDKGGYGGESGKSNESYKSVENGSGEGAKSGSGARTV